LIARKFEGDAASTNCDTANRMRFFVFLSASTLSASRFRNSAFNRYARA